MTIYKFSVITSEGYPYYQLKVKEPLKANKLYLRFFDFSKSEIEEQSNFDQSQSFELQAGLVSALFKFAQSMHKDIEILEFNPNNHVNKKKNESYYFGNVLITAETEPYLFHRSVYAKMDYIYKSILSNKIPLSSAMEILPKEEDKIIDILTDAEARKRVKNFKNKINHEGNDFLLDMKNYGLNGICITSFDLSPIMVVGKKYTLEDTHEILRNIGNIPEIPPMNWIYRQSDFADEQIWVYIYKSNVGPSIDGLFEPYLYLLFCDLHSYLGEFPERLGRNLDNILG